MDLSTWLVLVTIACALAALVGIWSGWFASEIIGYTVAVVGIVVGLMAYTGHVALEDPALRGSSTNSTFVHQLPHIRAALTTAQGGEGYKEAYDVTPDPERPGEFFASVRTSKGAWGTVWFSLRLGAGGIRQVVVLNRTINPDGTANDDYHVVTQ